MPLTLLPGDILTAGDAAAELGPPPFNVKIARSTKGRGIMLVPDIATLQNIMDTLHSLKAEFILQRAVVGEFRSNLDIGGAAETVALNDALRQVAETATRRLGLDMAGAVVSLSVRQSLSSRGGQIGIAA